MEGWLIWVIVLSIFIGIWLISWLNSRLSRLQEDARKYKQIKPKLDDLENREKYLENRQKHIDKEVERKQDELYKEIEKKDTQVKRREYAVSTREITLEKLVEQKTKGFPWLAAAYNEYLQIQDRKKSEYLKNKSHPAMKAAEELRQIAKERRLLFNGYLFILRFHLYK